MRISSPITRRCALALCAGAVAVAATPAWAQNWRERDRRRRIIRQVQRTLSQLHYDPGPADGSWGGKTASAVAAFQRDQGLRRTGRLNAETLDRLSQSTRNRGVRRRRRRR